MTTRRFRGVRTAGGRLAPKSASVSGPASGSGRIPTRMISRGSIIFSRHPDRARPAGRARRLSTHAAPSSKSLRPRRADPHGYAVDLDLDPSSTGLDLAMPQPPLRNSGRSHIHNRRHELQPISIRPSCTRPTRSSASTARSSGAPRWSTSSPTRMPSSASSERSCSSRTMSGPSSVPVT